MKKFLVIAAIVAAAASSMGCATATASVASTSLKGKLVIKGSMPMVRVVLIHTGGEEWELLDVPAETAMALQNKQVTVEGKVVRAQRSELLAPTLRVARINFNAR